MLGIKIVRVLRGRHGIICGNATCYLLDNALQVFCGTFLCDCLNLILKKLAFVIRMQSNLNFFFL